jgi:serine/threonine protein kinase
MAAFAPKIRGYKILGELGRGGMGIVYKAKDLRNKRIVALKMIVSGRGADFLELARFRIEAEAIASLAHPNIVLIHEVGVHLGYPFFVLQYADGGNLAEKIGSQPIPCGWTAQVTRKLALAMQHAHERGIIHRDLKPSNVLMMSDDIPKVTDFGLAKLTPPVDYSADFRSGVTIAITTEFLELTQLRGEYTRVKENSNDDLSATLEDFVVRTKWKKQIGSTISEESLQRRGHRDNGRERALRNRGAVRPCAHRPVRCAAGILVRRRAGPRRGPLGRGTGCDEGLHGTQGSGGTR